MFRFLLVILLLIPTNGWCVTQWNKAKPASGDNLTSWPTDNQANLSILDTLVSNYRKGLLVFYKNATTLTVSTGEVTASNSGGSTRLFLQNTTNTDITTANLDAGVAFSSSTTYYVYAGTSTATAAAPTFYISLSSSAPTGVTYYKILGSFVTDSSANIVNYAISDEAYGNVKVDANGNSLVPAVVKDFGTSASSSTQRYGNQIKIAYGNGLSVAGGSSSAVTNLPFTATTSYVVVCSASASFGTPPASTDQQSGNLVCANTSATSFTAYNTDDQSKTVQWFAIGY